MPGLADVHPASIVQDVTPPGVYSYYRAADNSIHLDQRFSERVTMSAALAHELANERYAEAHGDNGRSRTYCVAEDTEGYAAELAMWRLETAGQAMPELYLPADTFTRIWAKNMAAKVHPDYVAYLVEAGCSAANGWTNP